MNNTDKRKQIIHIVGARPQFVKLAPLFKALSLQSNLFDQIIIHTGQHYDAEMSDIFWQELGLPPWEENLMVGSGSHGVQTARILEGVESFLLKTPNVSGV